MKALADETSQILIWLWTWLIWGTHYKRLIYYMFAEIIFETWFMQVFSYREAHGFAACEFKRSKRVCKRESLYSLNFSRICVNKVSLLRCSCLFRFEGSRTHARRIIRLVIPRMCCRRCIPSTHTRASIIPNILRCPLT